MTYTIIPVPPPLTVNDYTRMVQDHNARIGDIFTDMKIQKATQMMQVAMMPRDRYVGDSWPQPDYYHAEQHRKEIKALQEKLHR